MAATPESESDRLLLTLGLATTFQCVPFQCSTSVRLPLPLLYSPTAQTSVEEMAATPFRKLVLVPTFGLETLLHTPQIAGPCVCCGRVAADAAVNPLNERAKRATTAMRGKNAVRGSIKAPSDSSCFNGRIPYLRWEHKRFTTIRAASTRAGQTSSTTCLSRSSPRHDDTAPI